MRETNTDISKKNKAIVVALTAFATVALIVVLLISSMQLLCFTGTAWYEHEYSKYSVLEDVRGEEYRNNPMKMDAALEVTEVLIDYSTGRISELSDFYTDREKAHLADCRVLFLLAFRARNILLALIVLAAIGVAYLCRQESKKLRRSVFKTYVVTIVAILALLLVLYLMPGGEFNQAFTQFHMLFFDNDLWLLDPLRDNLINLLPIGFFIDTVTVIVAMTVGGLVLTGVIIYIATFMTTKNKH